jgi:hypothetical protein
LARWRGAAWDIMAVIIILPRMKRPRPGSWLPLPSLRSAQLTVLVLASGFYFYSLLAMHTSTSPTAAKISEPAAQNTQPQQAPTQAPSTKQSNSKPGAAQRQAAWLGLAASGFWLLASWPLASASPAAKISGPAAQSMAMAMGDAHPSSLPLLPLGQGS